MKLSSIAVATVLAGVVLSWPLGVAAEKLREMGSTD